jgi:hypothetical protein
VNWLTGWDDPALILWAVLLPFVLVVAIIASIVNHFRK